MLSTKNRRLAFTIFGCFISTLGIGFLLFWEKIFNVLLENVMAMVLRPNSQISEMWETPPFTLTLDFYIYNWTNPEDFHNKSIKPILKQMGPYRFIDKPTKVDIKWHPENATVSYRKKSNYFFDAAGSVGTLDDQIVTINSLAVSAAHTAKNWNFMRRAVIDITLQLYNYDITVKKTARELLFAGFEDALLNIAYNVPPSMTDMVVPFEKFGYCYARNNSAQFTGTFNVHTGADNIHNIGQLHNWNYKNTSKFYRSECARIYGSPGEFQPPHLQKNDTLHLFLTDLCRPIPLDYSESNEVEGILGYKYHAGLRAVDNGTLYPENKCYCNGQCIPSGVMNVSSCWYDMPVFASYPHFYNADPYYGDQVEGLNPQKDLHESYFTLEPNTGYVLEFSVKMQSNILVDNIPSVSIFRNSRRIFFPLFWFEEKTRISPQLANILRMIPRMIIIGHIFGGLLLVLGVICCMWYPLFDKWSRSQTTTTAASDVENEIVHKDDKIENMVVISPGRSPMLKRAEECARVLRKTLSFDSGDDTSGTEATSTSSTETNRSCISINTS